MRTGIGLPAAVPDTDMSGIGVLLFPCSGDPEQVSLLAGSLAVYA